MLDDSFEIFVVFDHFLMMASALLVRTGSNSFAHHSVEVPFPFVFLASFNHLFELDQKINIFVVFFISPVRSGEWFFVVWSIIKTKNNFFGSENPRLDFIERNIGTIEVLGLSLGNFRKEYHVIHLNDIIKNIIKPHLNIIKGPWFKNDSSLRALDPATRFVVTLWRLISPFGL